MSSSVWLTDELSAEIKQNDNFHENAELAVKDVFNGKLDITVLVERLSGVLTDINPEFRARGMQFFSKILAFLLIEQLSEAQLNFIAAFYVDRLKDNHRVIPPVLEGVVALSKMKNLPKDTPSQFLMAIYNNVPCQQQVRVDRNNIYSIISTFLQRYPEELKSMGSDLVYGVISAMDGERDPRNLLFLFSILPSFLRIIPLGHLAEEMFEVIACYYPVDFNSPVGDPNAITRNDLAEKLCLCLCATPSFAEFCLTLLLEKLDSQLRLAKLDSLKLLKQCCCVFSSTHLDPHLQKIWSIISVELSNKGDDEMTQSAHDALQAIVNNLCSDDSQPNISDSFLKQILLSMKLLLADAKTKTALEFPLKVFLTTANASEKSCLFITENVVPLLIVHYHLNLDETLQSSSLKWFALAFATCKNWNLIPQISNHFEQIANMCINALNGSNVDLKICSLNTIAAIAEIIRPDDVKTLCQILDRNIHNDLNSSVSDYSKKCLLKLASKDTKMYSDYIADKLNLEEIIDDNILLEKRLDLLCCLSSVNTFTDCVLNKFIDMFSTHDSKAYIIIAVLLKNFEDDSLFNDDAICERHTKYNILKCSLQWSEQNMNLNNTEVLDNVSKLIIKIVKTLGCELQSDIFNLYLPGYVNQLLLNNKLIILIEALLNSSRQEVEIVEIQDILSHATNLAVNENNCFIRRKSCLLMANILNKHCKKEKFSKHYIKIKENLNKLMEINMKEEQYPNIIVLYSWLVKSLFLNGHTDAPYWLGKLTELLGSEKWCLHAAKSFKLIMADSSEVLNTNCYCIIGLLYRQKVFQLFMAHTDKLEKGVNREPYLLAWAYIIQSVSKTVLQMESLKVSSILIDSLDFVEKELLLTTLETLSFLIQMKNPNIGSSLQSLIPRLIKLTTLEGVMNVRMSSLQCLYDIGNSYPTVLLLPYKEDVISQLSVTLDDRKRLVRRVAVKARTRWFLVGSPGEDKIKS